MSRKKVSHCYQLAQMFRMCSHSTFMSNRQSNVFCCLGLPRDWNVVRRSKNEKEKKGILVLKADDDTIKSYRIATESTSWRVFSLGGRKEPFVSHVFIGKRTVERRGIMCRRKEEMRWAVGCNKGRQLNAAFKATTVPFYLCSMK